MVQRQLPGPSPGFAPDALTCVEMYIHPASSELGRAPMWGSGAKAIVTPVRGIWGYWLVTLWVCVTFTPRELVLFPWLEIHRGAPFAA